MSEAYPVWGWGEPADEPRLDDLAAAAPHLSEHLGFGLQQPESPAPLAELPADQVSATLPASLAALASADPIDRARHGLGRSYRDVIRGLRGRPDAVPDAVLRPSTEADVTAVLDWCSDAGVAMIPYAGGTSVVGGVEPALGDDARSICLDLGRLSGVREVQRTDRAARIGAGTTGPQLEDQLRPHGLTARFFPQSFERSTVGGWVATRAAGHFSTRLVHIDELVESVRAITPAGPWESRRLPGSGAGPSPDRLLLGSEGILGVITETWLRVQPRPQHRWAATLAAPDLATALTAIRTLLQDGMLPAAARALDAREAAITGTLSTGEAVLVLGLESYGAPVDAEAERALDLCRQAGLRVVESGLRGGTDAGSAATWRSSFVRAPYLREQLVLLGAIVETFETAVPWSVAERLIAEVTGAVEAALARICGGGTVTCRSTHAYPDGVAPYFTVLAPARRGCELDQWAEIKAAASEAILAAGGTITHHHAVGRDHRPWYDEQRPEPFAAALRAAKSAVDPTGVLNPGVLVEP